MGDGFAVAVPVILLVALAVGLIVRGRRSGREKVAAQHAPWKVGAEPDNSGTVVYLYQEVGGAHTNRCTYGRIDRKRGDYQEELLDLISTAELEASMLNDNH